MEHRAGLTVVYFVTCQEAQARGHLQFVTFIEEVFVRLFCVDYSAWANFHIQAQQGTEADGIVICRALTASCSVRGNAGGTGKSDVGLDKIKNGANRVTDQGL